MSIAKMKRLRLIGLSSERDELLKKLMGLGCVELTEAADEYADDDCAGLLTREESASATYRAENQRYVSALAILGKYAPYKTGLFYVPRPVTAAHLFDADANARAGQTADAVASLEAEITRLHGEENRLRNLETSLRPWLGCDIPLQTEGTAETRLLFLTIPGTARLETAESALTAAAPACQLDQISADRDMHYCTLLAHKAAFDAALEALRAFGYAPVSFEGLSGTAAEETDRIGRELKRTAAEIGEKTAQIAACAVDRELLQMGCDRSEQDLQRETAREKLMTTGTVFSLTGWAPAAQEAEITALLNSFCTAYEFSDPQDGDEIPVKLNNNALTKPLNMVTEMYSLPDYHNVDPNPLIMPFFTLFFGMMYADLGYGLVLVILGILGKKYIKKSGTIQYMTGLLIECGITTAFFGTLFGSCFGDAINYIPALSFLNKIPFWAWKDPTKDPMWFMYASLVVGAIQLVCGQIIHMVLGFRDGEGLEGVLDVVPWWITFAGIGLGVLGHGWTVLIAGAASLVLTQGRHKKGVIAKFFGGLASLYDITSWLGDILSYTRLMALMLAGSVIAQVFNMLGSMPGSVLFFIFIFIIGHAFNMGINIIGTYVHAARLQYLEFFGKFYQDGGKPFKPLAYKTKYTQIVKEEQ